MHQNLRRAAIVLFVSDLKGGEYVLERERGIQFSA